MGKVPLKVVLKSFLDHYQKLETSVEETTAAVKEVAKTGRSTPPPLSLYAQEFLKLKELTESLKNDPSCPMIEGHSDVNRKKNRYKDILPYDNSRVILSEYPGVPGSDYINANYVRGSSGNQRAYIASQGPLPNTLIDFWRMIWETEVLVIVMACNEREAGKYKCESYWPVNTDEKQQYGNITVEHIKWRQVCPDFLVRTFKVCADNEERTICQFHYTTWPDHGVPSSVHPIIELVRLMRDVQSTESRPILVHCSAGCGRTGTICSIDYVWALLRTGKLKEDFSLFEIISDMRRQRIAMVQTVEQYMLCYKAVSTLFEQHLKLIDSHTYENIDCDGEPLGIKHINDDASSSLSVDSSCASVNSKVVSEQSVSAYRDQCISEKPEVNNYSTEHEEEMQPASLSGSLEEVRPHEKLVGKATVIRRPSIAKLKAIFDNPPASNMFDVCRQQGEVSRSCRLQRSQSIKENIRNLNFNFHLEINQPKVQSRKMKSYTLSAAKLSVYKKNLSFANLTFQTDKMSPSCSKSTDMSENTSTKYERTLGDGSANEGQSSTGHNSSPQLSNSPQNSTNSQSNQTQQESNAESDQDYSPQLVISMHQYSKDTTPSKRSQSHQQSSSIDRGSTPNAPPKPPRTYQHIVDDSCIVRTSEGRLIVSVAHPRQHKIETNFIPINVPAAATAGQMNNNAIYERLGARKFNISSPNLNFNDHQMSFSIPANQLNLRQPRPARFYDNNPTANTIYSNQLMTKYSRPLMASQSQPPPLPPTNFNPYSNNLTYIDVLSSQHFQHHQAKPIILQPSIYEPIYSSAANRQHSYMPTATSMQPQPSGFQIAPPTRPRSISHGTFRPVGPTPENIYSNREMCFNLKPSPNVSLMPLRPPKENVYSEIGTLAKDSASTDGTEVSDKAKAKSGSFKVKIKNAFKAFKINRSKSSVANKTAPMDGNSVTVVNGGSINPLNGQPISRPPHSHRFQSPTQWTQV